MHWQATERISFLAGAYRGFSPAGPGSGDVDPEQSLNLEYGVRFGTPSARLEAVGFFSDYENLLGRCRVSDSGCEAGEEFNGGRVEIAGAEIVGSTEFALTETVSLTLDFTYTYTESAFQTGFLSQFTQWGLVRRGDELPYLPEHIGRAGGAAGKRSLVFLRRRARADADARGTRPRGSGQRPQRRRVPFAGPCAQPPVRQLHLGAVCSSTTQRTKPPSSPTAHSAPAPTAPRSFVLRLKRAF